MEIYGKKIEGQDGRTWRDVLLKLADQRTYLFFLKKNWSIRKNQELKNTAVEWPSHARLHTILPPILQNGQIRRWAAMNQQERPSDAANLQEVREEHKGKPATMGGALLVASMTVRDQPVECGDAAALQAAESRAAGSPLRGGVAEAAHAAAKVNAHVTRQGDKIMLGEVLTDAPELTALEKAVTAEDARTVAEAEKRYSPSGEIYGGGVAAIVAAAARTNQERD